MYETLLFLHVLSAAIVFITLAAYSAFALGAKVERPSFNVAEAAWNVSGAGLLIFGVWLALNVDGYELWDAWILIAIVLFAFATETGRRAMLGARVAMEEGTAMASNAASWHWARTALIVLILADMIWKPWA